MMCPDCGEVAETKLHLLVCTECGYWEEKEVNAGMYIDHKIAHTME